MRELSVVNLGILLLLVFHKGPGSVKEVAEFGWTMFSVRDMKAPLGIVDTVHGVYMTVVTVKMHRSSVQNVSVTITRLQPIKLSLYM